MQDRSLTILVTRPLEDAEPMAAELHRRNANVLLEPMLEIVALEDVVPDLRNTAGLLFTSANGVRSFARVSAQRSLKVFAVGDATAAAARSVGFADVDNAGGNVEDLVALVKKAWLPARGALLHAAGRSIAGELAADLRKSGYEVQRIALYDAKTASALSEELCEAMRVGGLDYALFFSPRTAKTFVNLMTTAGLSDSCQKVEAICLSAAVADVISSLPWRCMTVAAEPDQKSLLSTLDGRLAHAIP